MADKVENFYFRMTEEEYKKLKENASQKGISVSEYIRQVAIHGIHGNASVLNKDDYMLKRQYVQECNHLNYEINRVGNNINQIVKDYNSEFYSYADKKKLTELLNKIISLEEKVISMEEFLWQ